MFHMCTLGECFVWMEQMLGESVELSELGNVLCGSELVLGECFSWTAGEDDTHSGLTRLHVCLLSCEICDCLPSVIKCYQVLPWCCHGVAMVLPWWFVVYTIPSSVPCTQVMASCWWWDCGQLAVGPDPTNQIAVFTHGPSPSVQYHLFYWTCY